MELHITDPLDPQALRDSFGDVVLAEDELSLLRRCGPLQRGDLLVDASAEGRLARVLALLMLNTDAHARRAGRTALHLAAAGDHLRVMQLLLLARVDIDALDDSLMTPLHLAAQHGAAEAVELLVGRGAKLEAIDDRGRAPLGLALDGGHALIAQSLQQAIEFEQAVIARRQQAGGHGAGSERTPHGGSH